MTTTQKVIVTLLLLFIVVMLFWTDIKGFFNKSLSNNTTKPINDTPCATPGFVGGNNGLWVNGVCVANHVVHTEAAPETGRYSQQTTVQDLYYSNGRAVSSMTRKQVCSENCLIAYPAGSQYHGYYYCNKNCGSF